MEMYFVVDYRVFIKQAWLKWGFKTHRSYKSRVLTWIAVDIVLGIICGYAAYKYAIHQIDSVVAR